MEVNVKSIFPRNLTHKIPCVREEFSESPFFFYAIWETLRGSSKNIEDTIFM